MSKGILIAGAAGTIGSAIVEKLSSQNFNLHLADIDEKKLINLAKCYPNCSYTKVNLTEAEPVNKLLNSLNGKINAVVIAVGTDSEVCAFEDCSDTDFENSIRTNIYPVWLLMKNALKLFKMEKNGSIVIVSSVSGIQAAPMLAPYCASKHAVQGLMKTAAKEAAKFGVRVNSVNPGPVDSPMQSRIDLELAAKYPERLANAKNASKFIPMQKYAKPTDVANVVAFLCSEDSSYCTGGTYPVDGGITCR